MKKLIYILFSFFYPVKRYWAFSFFLIFTTIFIGASLSVFAQTPTEEWVARYNSPHSVNDRFRGMALDKFGNAYVTGLNTDSVNGNDIITIKINSSGQIVWSTVYSSGGPGSNDIAQGIDVDESGDAYVTGYTGMNLGPYDYITIKYNINGIIQWVKLYDSGFGTDEPNAIKIDNRGNIYVTGAAGTNNPRTITIKYNSNGDSVWVRKNLEGSSSFGLCMDIDNSNNIYIGGKVNLTNFVSYIMKYDQNGNVIWSNSYVTGYINVPYSIAVDSIGNGAFAGVILLSPSSSDDYYTVRFTNSGNTLWQRYYNGPVNSSDVAQSVTMDNSGSTYVTGSSAGTGIGYDYTTIKYNLAGDSVWVKRYNGPADDYDQAYSICLDSLGNSYVTGASVGTGTGDDYATIKYDASGVQKWVVRYNGPANGGDGAGSVILGNNLTIYVGGESDGIGTGKDLAVVKYDQIIGIVNNMNEAPLKYQLFQNYPNPFNNSTVITYYLPKKSYIHLSIFNSIGQMVKVLVDGNEESGYYSEIINSDNLSSGIYFYKITVDNNFVDTKKLIIIK
jgi:hypothetical protein